MGKESMGKTVVLPVRHGISHEEVKQNHPTLANKLSTTTEKGIESVVAEIVSVLGAPSSLHSAAESLKYAKLYDARPERVLRKGYQVKYVSVHKPGSNVKYMPVYRSPSGDEVFEDEATVEGVAIVEVAGTAPSRSERERAIDKLSRILSDEPHLEFDWLQLTHAMEAMALEADLKLKIGQQMAQRLPPQNPDSELDYAVRLLVGSALKEAIAPLTELLIYEASWDHVTCCEVGVHDFALTTLRKFVADNPEFQYEAACVTIALRARHSEDYHRDLLKTWAIELLVGLADSTSTKRDWAREQLKEFDACYHCGAKLTEKMKQCPECGKAL